LDHPTFFKKTLDKNFPPPLLNSPPRFFPPYGFFGETPPPPPRVYFKPGVVDLAFL